MRVHVYFSLYRANVDSIRCFYYETKTENFVSAGYFISTIKLRHPEIKLLSVFGFDKTTRSNSL